MAVSAYIQLMVVTALGRKRRKDCRFVTHFAQTSRLGRLCLITSNLEEYRIASVSTIADTLEVWGSGTGIIEKFHHGIWFLQNGGIHSSDGEVVWIIIANGIRHSRNNAHYKLNNYGNGIVGEESRTHGDVGEIPCDRVIAEIYGCVAGAVVIELRGFLRYCYLSLLGRYC